jgi:hypothetical protein
MQSSAGLQPLPECGVCSAQTTTTTINSLYLQPLNFIRAVFDEFAMHYVVCQIPHTLLACRFSAWLLSSSRALMHAGNRWLLQRSATHGRDQQRMLATHAALCDHGNCSAHTATNLFLFSFLCTANICVLSIICTTPHNTAGVLRTAS